LVKRSIMPIPILTFKQLINKVKKLNRRYEQLAASSGENFNIFHILKLQSSETRLHSAFIAELLNPKGTHGLKDEFLKLFLKTLEVKHTDFNTQTATVDIELHVGAIGNNYETGGRIDICIRDASQHKIIIENKIYAIDQLNQLFRYYQYDNNADLYYLTLDGRAPEEKSYKHLKCDEHYKLASYQKDILGWLQQCREKAVMKPILRESITQYINLIKQLTGQTINDNMNEEVAGLITENSENLEAAFILSKTLDHACDILLDRLDVELAEIAQELNLDYDFNVDIKFNKNYKGIYFYPKHWTKLNIAFQFQALNCNLVFGIARKELASGPLPQKWYTVIAERIPPNGRKVNEWWPFHEACEPYTNWDLYEPWAAIISGEMKRFIKQKVEEILELFKDQKF